MKAQTAKLQARIARMRKMLERERLDTVQLAQRLGMGKSHVLVLARSLGLEHRVEKRTGARAFTASDF